MKAILKTRSLVMRYLRPAGFYWLATRDLHPISDKFGFDRGTPIDRFWIEGFLGSNKGSIKGDCLEITDNTYTREFGNNISRSDVLDINKSNKSATIFGDLRNLNMIRDNTYDCVILTHVLGIIDDYHAAISEIFRILKPGGTLLATVSCFSPVYDPSANLWRFTPAGAKYVFEKYFFPVNLTIKSYGNVFAGQCFWAGMSQEELSRQELEYNDPRFPCIVAIKAVKV
jgi:SAM-dependent methyltransferase